MSLEDFKIAREVVTFQGGELTVRGLALIDVAALMRGYLAELNTLFQLYEKEESRDTAIAQSAKFVITIVQETPALVGQLIILASDSDAALIKIAERLPLPVQVELLRKILELTFEEAGGAKKFLDSLMDLVSGLRPATSTGV